MGAGPVRDDGALVAGLDRWLAAHRHPRVVGLRRPSSGWTNETLMVDLDGGTTVVVRMPALVPSFPDDDVAREAEVLRALATSGVAVPDVIAVEADSSWLGAPFVVMSFVTGHVVGDVPALDPWLATLAPEQQQQLHETYLAALARLHAVDRHTVTAKVARRAGLDAELEYWNRYVHWAANGSPTRRLLDALAWCASTVPADIEENWSLLWGDARLGNAIFADESSIAALLDWEGATIGPPEMDLGWYLALDALTTHFVGRTVPGFLDRAGVIERYERASGRVLQHLDWHEVFALVRSIAINECQARLAAQFGTRYPGVAGDDNPVLDYVWERINRLSVTR